jgi:F-type H+-transporting ATPase subunit delta
MSVGGSVARRYARALLEIGLETGKIKLIQRQIQDVAEAIESSEELRNVMRSPAVLLSQRKQVFELVLKRLGAAEHVRNTCMLLIDRGRTEILPAISSELALMVDEHEGVVRGEVVSATPVSKVYVDRLTSALKNVTGKTTLLETRVDKELIGGVITRVGGVVYDGSLKARMARVRELMLH